MSEILIRGMEMPTGSFPIRLELWPDGQVCALEHGEYWSVAKAVPVPPHGRLIDADALIREHRADNYDYAIYASYLVQNAPTIITASE